MEIISNRWLNLKRRAQNERDPEKLINLLGEIDDLLAELEKRVTMQDDNSRLSEADSKADSRKSIGNISVDDSGIWSQ